MGGLDEEVKNQKEETKIVDLDEEGGSRIALYKNVVIPTLAVSGFFTPKMAAEILEATDEEL